MLTANDDGLRLLLEAVERSGNLVLDRMDGAVVNVVVAAALVLGDDECR